MEAVPHYYDLFWRSREMLLGASIHKKVIPEVFGLVTPKSPVVIHLQETLKLGEFRSDPDSGFGFSEADMVRLVSQPEKDYVRYALNFPQPKKSAKGKEINQRPATQVSATLQVLLSSLFCVRESPDTKQIQLATYELAYAGRSMHGFPLWGQFSVELSRWIASFGDHEFENVKKEMQRIFKTVFSFSDRYQATGASDGRFHFSVPGQCACLGPDGGESRNLSEGMGYQYGSHNVDGPVQQLVLLVGVITLVKEASKAINKRE